MKKSLTYALILGSLLPVAWSSYCFYRLSSVSASVREAYLSFAETSRAFIPCSSSKIYKDVVFGLNPGDTRYPHYFSSRKGRGYLDSELSILSHREIDLVFEKTEAEKETDTDNAGNPVVSLNETDALHRIQVSSSERTPYYIEFENGNREKGLICIKGSSRERVMADIIMTTDHR